MKTKIIRENIGTASEIIKSGGLVAVPTETVYGLAGSGLDRDAVQRIYDVKGRPEIKPLSLMVQGESAMEAYCAEVPEQARRLAEKYWPGPLTIVLKAKKDIIPDIVRAGGDTIGLRCPDHPLTLALLRECGVPLAAPSANPTGAPSPKTAREVMGYFDGGIEGVIDGGACGIGRESTIISLAQTPYRILREGALPSEEIEETLAQGLTVIGITGGSGTGKTTATDVLGDMGALCIDCDAVYHRLLEIDMDMLSKIKSVFPGAFFDGVFDRKALGRMVFGSPEALERLGDITHPHVVAETKRLLRVHAMNGGTLAALDAAELISAGLAPLCRKVFFITAPKADRVERIMARESISREYAESRVSAQRGDEYYIENTDGVLMNDNTRESFAAKCRAAFMEVIKNG